MMETMTLLSEAFDASYLFLSTVNSFTLSCEGDDDDVLQLIDVI